MSIGGFAVVAIIVVVAVIFLKKKGALGADASTDLSDSMTGGGTCPAGSSGLDDLAASGNVTADQITQYCSQNSSDCGCTSL